VLKGLSTMQTTGEQRLSGARGDAGRRPDALSSRDRLRRLVEDILATKATHKHFSDDDTLAEIGIASMDMVTLLLSVESEFDVEVPQSQITAEVFRSISSLDALIQRLSAAG